jgi:Na+/melibiose symporter-like transporter
MIADAVDAAEESTGVRNDGISFATLTFVTKVMSAISVLLFGIFVVLAGYEEGIIVTPEMQNTVWIAITLVPAASCLLSAVPFLFYRVSPASSTAPARATDSSMS